MKVFAPLIQTQACVKLVSRAFFKDVYSDGKTYKKKIYVLGKYNGLEKDLYFHLSKLISNTKKIFKQK